jgi:hypothetical protein
MKTKVAIVASITVIALVICTLCLILAHRSKKQPEPHLGPMPLHGVTSDNVRPPSKQNAFTNSISNLNKEEPTTNRAHVVVEILRHARPGSLTTTQVRQLIEELVTLSDFDQAIRPLLVSDVISERLLGVYALMEKEGLTEETRKMALTDPSPYVRAEITTWLLQKHDFASLETILSWGLRGRGA